MLGTNNDSPQYNTRLSHTSKGMPYTFHNDGRLQTYRRNNNNQNMPKRRTVAKNTKVLYKNTDQFPNKIYELLIHLGIFKPNVIMVTEVLPKNSETKTTKASLNITGYDWYPNIEQEEIIRGIALYVSNNLIVDETKFNTNSNENVWCTLKLKENDKLLLGCIYRSPTYNNVKTQKLGNLNDKSPSHILIAGDFNYPEIEWSYYYSNTTQQHRSQIFLDKIQDLFLYHHVAEFTWYREWQNPSILDLISTNEEGMVNNL